jgi:hypothetical protein
MLLDTPPVMLPVLKQSNISLSPAHHPLVLPLRQLGTMAMIFRLAERIAHAGQHQQ